MPKKMPKMFSKPLITEGHLSLVRIMCYGSWQEKHDNLVSQKQPDVLNYFKAHLTFIFSVPAILACTNYKLKGRISNSGLFRCLKNDFTAIIAQSLIFCVGFWRSNIQIWVILLLIQGREISTRIHSISDKTKQPFKLIFYTVSEELVKVSKTMIPIIPRF